jgi:hypothetical protein
MIDRKTLWLLILLCLATTATAVWRLSLLPDWTRVPFTVGRSGPHIEHGLVLFVPPLSLLFMIGLAFATRWLVSGPEESVKIHQRRNRLALLGTGVMVTLMQFFIIGRSLDYGNGLNADAISRGVIIVSAILMMLQGNNMPKLPWISSRFPALQLDPWQSARAKRFAGRMSIGLGLIMIAVAALLPARIIGPAVMSAVPLYIGVIVWYSLRLKREPSSPELSGWAKE